MTTTYPAHSLKPGDIVTDGREVFDTRPALGFRFALIFTDGTRVELAADDAPVTVIN